MALVPAITAATISGGDCATFATAEMRASQDEAAQLLLMMKRELLRDHSAHRDPEQRGASNAERVHQAGGVVGHLLDGVGRVGFVGAPRAAIVEHHAFVVTREFFDLLVPGEQIRSESADHDQGPRSRAMHFVVDFDIANALSGHGGECSVMLRTDAKRLAALTAVINLALRISRSEGD